MFLGIDWAAESHDICVVDSAGKIRGQATVAHSRDGFEELVKHMVRWAKQGEILVGIERPEGRLVDRILEAGYPIVVIPTFAMKDLRRRYAVGGAKSDPGDAYVIADVASEICLAFVERYPTPESAARLGELRLGSFLKKAGYSGRRSAAELLERLRSAPTGVAGVEAEARADAVRSMVRVMRALNRSIKDLERAVVAHLGEHPDAEVFTSLPRSGRINAAQMLAEWGDCREAYPCPDAVSMLGGLCPVTHASGKHRDVSFRWACNKRLREAITTFADNSRHASPWAADVYRRAIARGCDHPHAVRILARAWVRVIWRCWQDCRPYEAALHGAAVLLEAA